MVRERRLKRKTLEFLKELPDGYYVLRECKLVPSNAKQLLGSREDRSDFIIIGPLLGVIVLEVKDWNIRTNKFVFLNQYEVRKTEEANGISKIIENPWHQADGYRNAILESLANFPGPGRLWVSSFVVYPKLSRTDFENVFVHSRKNNPQEKFTVDLSKTLFQEDLKPLGTSLLDHLAQKVQRSLQEAHRQLSLPYSKEQVEATVDWLVPSEMRVGGLPHDEEAERRLVVLDEQQQAWAFSDTLDNKKYLSDVAGSGKTNVLLSRAIYWAKQHFDTGGCRILVTTYSKTLEYELRRIFKAKIANDPHYNYYDDCIKICNVITLMETIIESTLEGAFEQWKSQTIAKYTEHVYIEDKLPEACVDILQAGKWQFEPFDYVLIDEIQDFSTWFLDVTISLLKDRHNLFTVGDVGQKLFDRELEWGGFDIVRQRVALQSRFLMYRSPQPIAKLAWKFLTANNSILNDLKEEGYQTEIKPKSPFHTKPVFISYSTEEDLISEATHDIHDYLYKVRPEQILCIGLKDGLLQQLYAQFVQASFPTRWAPDASAINGSYILFADYIEAKGLERDYVFILDADHLALQKNIFASAEQNRQMIIRDRIKLFVALTRAMREVRLYYIDQYHMFVKDLLRLQGH